MSKDNKNIFFALVVGFVTCVPSLVCITMPLRDSSLYALLTREFSLGNFDRAFSADYPPLLTFLGGTINVFVGEPFLADKIASCILFLIGIPGTYQLVKTLKGREVACIAGLLYAVCPYTVALATSGGVDSGKLGLLPWLAWSTLMWCENKQVRWGLLVGLIGGVLSYARGEGIFFVFLSLTIFVFCSRQKLPRNGEFSFAGTILSLTAAGCLLLLLITPLLVYQQSQTGYWLTHPSQIRLYNLLVKAGETFSPKVKARLVQPTIDRTEIAPSTQATTPPPASVTTNIDWLKNASKTVKGFYPPFLLLAVLTVAYPSAYRVVPTRKDRLPLCYIALNLAMFFPTNICTARYFQTMIPLYLHLAAPGALVIGVILTGFALTARQIRVLACLSLVVLALMAQKECDFFRSGEKIREDQRLAEIGRWIADNRESLPTYGQLTNSREYHNSRLPVILCVDHRIAYYASADCVILPKDRWVTPQKMVDFLTRNKVSLLLYDARMEESCPGFGAYWPTNPAFQPIAIPANLAGGNPDIHLLAFDPGKTKTDP